MASVLSLFFDSSAKPAPRSQPRFEPSYGRRPLTPRERADAEMKRSYFQEARHSDNRYKLESILRGSVKEECESYLEALQEAVLEDNPHAARFKLQERWDRGEFALSC